MFGLALEDHGRANLVEDKDYPERVTRMLEMFGQYCGWRVYVDNAFFRPSG